MIGSLSGILREKQAQELLVDVQGVGYEVLVSLNTYFALPEVGGALVGGASLVAEDFLGIARAARV